VDALLANLPWLVVGTLVVLLLARIVFGRASSRSGRGAESRSIRVIGVGGGGSNAVDGMVRAKTSGVQLIACNTDAQALRESMAPRRMRIGETVTRGLGAGGDPAVGRQAAEDDNQKIAEALAGADMVFVTAGLGGGTGSGAAPVVARIAREHGVLTVGVVTKPFAFEGPKRRLVANEAAAELLPNVDTLITIPNDLVLGVVQETASIVEAFGVVDDVLRQGVQGIVELLTVPGLVNLDFADVRSVMKDGGAALIGIGTAGGEGRAVLAARQAIASPLLEASIDGAREILLNVSGSASLALGEVTAAAQEVRGSAHADANVVFGASFDEELRDEIRVTVVATRFEPAARPESAVVGTQPVAPRLVTAGAAITGPTGATKPAAVRPEIRALAAVPGPQGRSDEQPTTAAGGDDRGPNGADEERPERPATERRRQVMPVDLDVPSILRRRRTDEGNGPVG